MIPSIFSLGFYSIWFLKSHLITLGVSVMKISDEDERSSLLKTVSKKRNWSKLCFRTPVGNLSTGDVIGISVWKQELEMELMGSHVHRKLKE